jgi:transposase
MNIASSKNVSALDIAQLHLHWRESQYKGKTYRSYSLARSYRLKGKSRKEIVLKLGKLNEDEVARWRKLLHAVKSPDAFLTTLDDLVVTQHYAYLDVAVANAVWEHWTLDTVFRHTGKRVIRLATVVRILTLNRCIDPAVKSKIPGWFRETALPWLLNLEPESLNSSRIFRELVAIEHHKEALCQHLFFQMHRLDPEAMKLVFYDVSSTTFSGTQCVLMKWGYCKEGYHNHVVLALVVNRRGLPFYWDVLPGGTADVTTITWLLERLTQRFQDLEVTLTFDRGLVSNDNLTALEQAQFKYISAMDKDQIEGITGLDFSIFSHLEPEQIELQAQQLPEFTTLTDTTYYREIGVQNGRRYLLCLSPPLFKKQRLARADAVRVFQTTVQRINAELGAAKKSRQQAASQAKFDQQIRKAKLSAFVTVTILPLQVSVDSSGKSRQVRTWQGTVVVDQKAMRHAGRLDGFWLLVTNHCDHEHGEFRLPAQDIIPPYQEKTVIESAFRDLKSCLDIRPVYVWTEAHVKAHYSVCVLAHLLNRTLTLWLHTNTGGESTKHIVSHESCYKELAGCQIDCIEVGNVGLSTYKMTRPTSQQKELLTRVEFTHLLEQEVPDVANALSKERM